MHLVATAFKILAAGPTPAPGPVVNPGSTYSPFYATAFNTAQYVTIVVVMSMVVLALIAQFIYTTVTRKHVGRQYQRSLFLGRVVVLVASLSYLVLLGKFIFGYAHVIAPNGHTVFIPTSAALLNLPIRYVDWAITVPLLVLELMAIGALKSARAARLRSYAMLAAFLMIVAGYCGGVLVDNGHNLNARLGFGLLSSVFFVIVFVILIYTLRVTSRELPQLASSAYRNATVLLMAVWFVYPIVYGLTGVVSGPGWIVGFQIALGIADLLAKVGFGLLVIRVARVRSTLDLNGQIEAMKAEQTSKSQNVS